VIAREIRIESGIQTVIYHCINTDASMSQRGDFLFEKIFYWIFKKWLGNFFVGLDVKKRNY
jgi:hypothetical protein